MSSILTAWKAVFKLNTIWEIPADFNNEIPKQNKWGLLDSIMCIELINLEKTVPEKNIY